MDQQFLQKLEETLTQLTSSDSATLSAATALYKEFSNKPETLPAIIYVVQNSSNESVRKLAAVEARKLVCAHWESVDASVQEDIKKTILATTFNEKVKVIRHQFGRVVAAIAQETLLDGSWNELMPGLVTAATDASNVDLRETATFILSIVFETNYSVFKPQAKEFFELFAKTILDSESRDVRVNSLLCLYNSAHFLSHYDDEESTETPKCDIAECQKIFESTIPSIIEVLKEVVTSGDADAAREVFNCFNDMLFISSSSLGEGIYSFINIMIEIATNKDIDVENRNYAIQFLSSSVAFKSRKISYKKLGEEITMTALKIVCEEVDVEAELNNTDFNENEEEDPNALALRLIAIAATELPPAHVVNIIFEQLNSLLSSQNKFERRAGLLAIGAAVSGAPDYYTSHVQKITVAVANGLKDLEPIVRVAALRSLVKLTSELQEFLSEKYEILLPLIIENIDSATNSSIYKYACISLDTLIEFMSIDAVCKYLEPLMNKLFGMLTVTENSEFRAIIVSAIGSTAYAAGTSFIPYFSKSIEILEPFIQNPASVEGLSQDDIELRALTFENISTMARAVGTEPFGQFAKPLVDAAYASIKCENSRLREAGFTFISNMAKVYRKEFAPFLPQIVPEIFKTLKQEEFNIDDDAEDEGFESDEENDNKYQVYTGIAIEKDVASVALSELALGTQELFTPYLEDSVALLSEQAADSYGMRDAALTSLWKIVEAVLSISTQKNTYPKGVPATSYVEQDVLTLIKHARDLTISSLNDELDLSMVAVALDNMGELIKIYGPIIVVDNCDTTSLEKLCVELMNLLKGTHPCQALDDDESVHDDEGHASETDDLLLESTLEVLVSLAIALGGDFVKIFDSFKDFIIANFKSKSKNKRVFATGALAEIALGLKEANPYTSELLQLFIESLETDVSVEVKGNAAYGIGILVYYSDKNFTSLYPQIFNLLSKLLTKVEKQESKDEDDEETQDTVHRSYANAAGCVARLALKHEDATLINAILPTLVAHLPLESAFEENTPIFQLIIRLYQSNNETIVPLTPKIIEIFAGVFLKESQKEELEKKSTLGREENIDKFKQFENAEMRSQIVELLKFLESKYSGSVSQNEFLSKVIA